MLQEGAKGINHHHRLVQVWGRGFLWMLSTDGPQDSQRVHSSKESSFNYQTIRTQILRRSDKTVSAAG
jgi:hypothetical protein